MGSARAVCHQDLAALQEAATCALPSATTQAMPGEASYTFAPNPSSTANRDVPHMTPQYFHTHSGTFSHLDKGWGLPPCPEGGAMCHMLSAPHFLHKTLLPLKVTGDGMHRQGLRGNPAWPCCVARDPEKHRGPRDTPVPDPESTVLLGPK